MGQFMCCKQALIRDGQQTVNTLCHCVLRSSILLNVNYHADQDVLRTSLTDICLTAGLKLHSCKLGAVQTSTVNILGLLFGGKDPHPIPNFHREKFTSQLSLIMSRNPHGRDKGGKRMIRKTE